MRSILVAVDNGCPGIEQTVTSVYDRTGGTRFTVARNGAAKTFLNLRSTVRCGTRYGNPYRFTADCTTARNTVTIPRMFEAHTSRALIL